MLFEFMYILLIKALQEILNPNRILSREKSDLQLLAVESGIQIQGPSLHHPFLQDKMSYINDQSLITQLLGLMIFQISRDKDICA